MEYILYPSLLNEDLNLKLNCVPSLSWKMNTWSLFFFLASIHNIYVKVLEDGLISNLIFLIFMLASSYFTWRTWILPSLAPLMLYY